MKNNLKNNYNILANTDSESSSYDSDEDVVHGQTIIHNIDLNEQNNHFFFTTTYI